MISLKDGKLTTRVEVTNISSSGIWLLAHDEELFLPYDEFPWFKKKTVDEILNVEEVSKNHYYWPMLDVDLSREIILHPERFPLMAKVI